MANRTTFNLHCGDRRLNLSAPKVMGILNLTPDSFYDGGYYQQKDLALKRVEQMIAQGADIIDIGAESSRPYAQSISLVEEIDRIMEALNAIQKRFDILISVDTTKPAVMQEAIKQGVHMINDIYALQQPGALEIISRSQVAVCLMHMQGTPSTMQACPQYKNVVSEVSLFLTERAQCCLQVGINPQRILLDPGFGFGKSTPHNLVLLKNLNSFHQLGFPLLVGLSRKATIGDILDLPVNERLYGSLSANVIAALNGAKVIRTHDIKPTAEAVKFAAAVLAQELLE